MYTEIYRYTMMARNVLDIPHLYISLHRSFSKNILHPSGCMLTHSLLRCYSLKDVSGIFQLCFIPFGRERKINLRRMKNRLA